MARGQKIQNVVDFHLFWFVFIRFKSSKNSLHRAFKWERGHKFWTDLKKNLDFVFFPLGLSKFWVGAWFPFDEGQFITQIYSLLRILGPHPVLSKNSLPGRSKCSPRKKCQNEKYDHRKMNIFHAHIRYKLGLYLTQDSKAKWSFYTK